jgi:hypothetical protein
LPVVAEDGDGGAVQPDGNVDAIDDNTKEAEKASNSGVAGGLNALAALGPGGARGSVGRDGGSKGLNEGQYLNIKTYRG